MDKNKQTDLQLENIHELLDVFIDKFSIATSEKDLKKKRQIAFELLSCVCAFNVSPFDAKDNCWTAIKKDNEYKADDQDGKINGYYIKANKDQITIKVMQSKFTDSVSQNDVELFFASVKKYLIQQSNLLPPGYKALKSIIDAINEKKEQYPNAISKFELYLCSGASNENERALRDCFNNESFDPNVKFKCIDYVKIDKCINKIRLDMLNEHVKKNINKLLDVFIDKFSIALSEKSDDKRRQIAFELLSCVCAFNVSPFYAKDNCWTATKIGNEYKTDGQDGKIDGYYIQANKHQITIKVMQSKFTDSVSQNDVELFFASVKKYLIQQSNLLPPGYKALKSIIDAINEKKEQYPNAISKFELYLCSGASNENERAFRDCFKNESFSPDVKFKSIDYVKIDKCIDKIRLAILNEHAKKNTIKLKSNFLIQNVQASNVAIAVLSGQEIIKLIKSEFEVNFELSRLFSGNVRGFLDETEVNLAIRDTLKKEPSAFLTKNNGVVITCDQYSIDPSKEEIVITNPVIINGQQTVSTIYNFYPNEKKSDKINVLVKFIKPPHKQHQDKKLIEIAKATNQSNKISSLDLLSNRPLFKDLSKQFGQENIYLKIKDGKLLNELFIQQLPVVDFKDLLQVWVAIFLKRPSDAKTVNKNIEIFTKAYESDNKTYKSLILPENSSKLINSFKYSYEVLKYKNKTVYEFFKDAAYYKHAQFFILYLLNEKNPNFLENSTNADTTNAYLTEVRDSLENFISEARKRKESANLEFTYNNYFKSTQPQVDYLSSIGEEVKNLTVVSAIEEFLNSQ